MLTKLGQKGSIQGVCHLQCQSITHIYFISLTCQREKIFTCLTKLCVLMLAVVWWHELPSAVAQGQMGLDYSWKQHFCLREITHRARMKNQLNRDFLGPFLIRGTVIPDQNQGDWCLSCHFNPSLEVWGCAINNWSWCLPAAWNQIRGMVWAASWARAASNSFLFFFFLSLKHHLVLNLNGNRKVSKDLQAEMLQDDSFCFNIFCLIEWQRVCGEAAPGGCTIPGCREIFTQNTWLMAPSSNFQYLRAMFQYLWN